MVVEGGGDDDGYAEVGGEGEGVDGEGVAFLCRFDEECPGGVFPVGFGEGERGFGEGVCVMDDGGVGNSQFGQGGVDGCGGCGGVGDQEGEDFLGVVAGVVDGDGCGHEGVVGVGVGDDEGGGERSEACIGIEKIINTCPFGTAFPITHIGAQYNYY